MLRCTKGAIIRGVIGEWTLEFVLILVHCTIAVRTLESTDPKAKFSTVSARFRIMSADHREVNAMTRTTLKGSCLCGAVKYEVTGEAKRFLHCHCSRCRKATGTGHASNLFLQPGELRWLQGEEQVRSFKLPEAKRFTNQFCATCGGRLPRQAPGTDVVLIPAGSLDDEAPMKPQGRVFYGSRAGWSCADDGLPTYPEMPPQ